VTPPLGATVSGGGTTFAVASEEAEALTLSLFDGSGRETQLPMKRQRGGVHSVYVAGVGPGARYGYRARGPWAPAEGQWFNPAKLLLDPYARALTGAFDARGPVYAFAGADACEVDSAPFVPRSIVTVEDDFDWGGTARPNLAWEDLVVEELHVRGFSMRHPGVPEPLRGTFEGLASPALLDHFQRIGVNAVELLPVNAVGVEPRLQRLGLPNFWGYSPLSYFALENRYAPAGQDAATSLKRMVRAFHQRGIEVVLDVVYNHTAELDELGPTLSLRGLDNRTYYRLEGGRYANPTGCGNALRVEHPTALALVTDSLRYLAETFHIDGFRFDLGATLGRADLGFDPRAALFCAMMQDPVLRTRKLVMEPWDVAGYALGQFAPRFSEWNDRFRDDVRGFFRGDHGNVGVLASRLAGSADLLGRKRAGAVASVNFVTAHDGFTLRDLVSYAHRHNEANGEENRDGHAGEIAMNHGVEGETAEADVNAARKATARALLATLLVSRGVPMLTGGDELWRTQGGNNNAYCLDGPTTWVDWEGADATMVAWVAKLTELRRRLPALRAAAYYLDDEVTWLHPAGRAMEGSDWTHAREGTGPAALGLVVHADGVVVLVNGAAAPATFAFEGAWERLADSGTFGRSDEPDAKGKGPYTLGPRAVAVLRLLRGASSPA